MATPAPGAPTVFGTVPPGTRLPPATGPAPVAGGFMGGNALFGGGPPDSVALGSASSDGAYPGFGQPTGPRAQRFIRDLQF
jgi:hypothetical protein